MSGTKSTSSIVRGGMLISLAQGVKVLAQFGSLIILSRLLTPADFGLYAALSPLLALVAVFQNLGLQQAIVQRPELNHGWIDRVFWSTCLLGVVTSAAVAISAPAVGWFYDDARLVPFTALSAITVLLSTLGTVPLGLLNRDLRFAQLAQLDIISTLLGVTAGIAMAALGLGYWALLLSPLVTSALNLLQSTLMAKYRPASAPALMSRSELSFGAHLTGFNFLNYFARNLDNVLIGRVLGTVALGFYDRAYKLLLFPLQNIITPISRVMIPTLSRIQADAVHFRSTYLRAARPLALIASPGIAAAAIVPEELVIALFGERWRPAAPILMWLCIAGCHQPLSSTTGWLFVASGKGKAMFRWGVYSSLTTILGFVVGLAYGAVGVAAAYACTDWLLRVPALYLVVGRVTPVRAADLAGIQLPLVAAGLLTFGIVETTLRQPLSEAPLLLCVSTALVSYLCATLVLITTRAGRATLTASRDLAQRLVRGA